MSDIHDPRRIPVQSGPDTNCANPTATATPRTDAEWKRYVEQGMHDAGEHFARILERELSAAQAALAEAKAEVARLIHDKGATNGRIQSQYFELTELRARVAAMEAQLTSLEQDKARIDWMAEYKYWPARITAYGVPDFLRGLYLREALDCARKGQP